MSKLLGQKAENKELIIKKEDKKLMTTRNHAFETNINKHVNSQLASMQDRLQSKVGSHGNKKKKTMLFKILHTGTWAGSPRFYINYGYLYFFISFISSVCV